MTINVMKPEILYNEYNPENEEKDVVESTEKVSEDFHGGDEVTSSVRDLRFALKSYSIRFEPVAIKFEPVTGFRFPKPAWKGRDYPLPRIGNEVETQRDNGNYGREYKLLNLNENGSGTEIRGVPPETPASEYHYGNGKMGGYNVLQAFYNLNENGSGTEIKKLMILIGNGKMGWYNVSQAFNIDENKEIERRLHSELYKLIEYLSDEEKQLTPQPGQTMTLNLKRVMLRQYERKPVSAYYGYRSRSQVILILDNSGSMDWLVDELDAFFTVALKRRDVQIYVAPNGHIERYYDFKTGRFEHVEHKDALLQIRRSGLPVIYVSDFDGADLAVELSQSNRVYWVCTETRYKYFRSHDWVNYDEEDFKGFFGRAFNSEEMISVLKEFVKNIHKQRFWYDNHDIEDFRESFEIQRPGFVTGTWNKLYLPRYNFDSPR
jgi:hypothetical protein